MTTTRVKSAETSYLRQVRALARMPRLVWPVVAGVVVVAIGIALTFWLATPQRHDIRIAGGPEGGTWIRIATGFSAILNRDEHGDILHVGTVVVAGVGEGEDPEKISRGSVDNLRRICLPAEDPDCVDFAFVQADSTLLDGSSPSVVRLVAILHENVLQLVVNSPGVTTIDDLGRDPDDLDRPDLRINLGPVGSGTRQLALRVLQHFRLATAPHGEQKEWSYEFTPSSLPFDDCPTALGDKKIDAAFFASALPTEWVRKCLDNCEDARLMSFGQASDPGSALEGLRMAKPPLVPVVVPTRTYGTQPEQPVGTISVATLFVTRRDVPEDVVKEVTRQLFENRSSLLTAHAAAARFAAEPGPNNTPYPWHPGAWAHYHRNAPSWFIQYAEAMSFGLTAMVLLGSSLLALRGIVRRRRKNRIDVYYLELEDLADRLDSNQTLLAEVRTVRSRLHGLRRRAFTELVAERLEADSSFVIFQDFLLSELATAEALIRAEDDATPDDAPSEPPDPARAAN